MVLSVPAVEQDSLQHLAFLNFAEGDGQKLYCNVISMSLMVNRRRRG